MIAGNYTGHSSKMPLLFHLTACKPRGITHSFESLSSGYYSSLVCVYQTLFLAVFWFFQIVFNYPQYIGKVWMTLLPMNPNNCFNFIWSCHEIRSKKIYIIHVFSYNLVSRKKYDFDEVASFYLIGLLSINKFCCGCRLIWEISWSSFNLCIYFSNFPSFSTQLSLLNQQLRQSPNLDV